MKETVQTLAGNGTKGADYKGGKKGTSQVLHSSMGLFRLNDPVLVGAPWASTVKRKSNSIMMQPGRCWPD